MSRIKISIGHLKDEVTKKIGLSDLDFRIPVRTVTEPLEFTIADGGEAIASGDDAAQVAAGGDMIIQDGEFQLLVPADQKLQHIIDEYGDDWDEDDERYDSGTPSIRLVGEPAMGARIGEALLLDVGEGETYLLNPGDMVISGNDGEFSIVPQMNAGGTSGNSFFRIVGEGKGSLERFEPSSSMEYTRLAAEWMTGYKARQERALENGAENPEEIRAAIGQADIHLEDIRDLAKIRIDALSALDEIAGDRDYVRKITEERLNEEREARIRHIQEFGDSSNSVGVLQAANETIEGIPEIEPVTDEEIDQFRGAIERNYGPLATDARWTYFKLQAAVDSGISEEDVHEIRQRGDLTYERGDDEREMLPEDAPRCLSRALGLEGIGMQPLRDNTMFIEKTSRDFGAFVFSKFTDLPFQEIRAITGGDREVAALVREMAQAKPLPKIDFASIGLPGYKPKMEYFEIGNVDVLIVTDAIDMIYAWPSVSPKPAPEDAPPAIESSQANGPADADHEAALAP